MAQVPRTVTGSVQTQALPQVYQSDAGATRDAFGGAQADASTKSGQLLGHEADVATEIAVKQAAEDNEREAKRLDVELSSRIRRVGYGDGQNDHGFYGTHGQAAVDAGAGTKEAVAKLKKEMLAEVKNPRVAKMFGTAADARLEQEFGTMDRHIMKSRSEANDAIAEARMGDAAANAAAAWNDPVVMQRSLHIAGTEARGIMERKGITDPATVDAKVREAQSVIVGDTVKAALAADNVVEAQKIFDANQAGLGAGARIELTKMLRDQSVSKVSQALRDKALALFPTDPIKGIEWIRQNAEGKVEDAAIEHTLQIYNLQHRAADDIRAIRNQAIHEANVAYELGERAKREAKEKARTEGWKAIEAGQTFASLPAGTKEAVDGTTANAMQHREQQIASGAPLVTNWSKYNEYSNMTPDQLHNVDLGQARTELADTEFHHIEALKLQADQGKLAATNPFSINGIFNKTADSLGLRGDAIKEKQRGELGSMFQEELDKAKKEKGLKGKQELSLQEQKEILRSLTDSIAIKGSVWGTNNDPAYKVKVPQEDRRKIIEAFQANHGGAYPTDFQIVKAYADMKNSVSRDTTRRGAGQ